MSGTASTDASPAAQEASTAPHSAAPSTPGDGQKSSAAPPQTTSASPSEPTPTTQTPTPTPTDAAPGRDALLNASLPLPPTCTDSGPVSFSGGQASLSRGGFARIEDASATYRLNGTATTVVALTCNGGGSAAFPSLAAVLGLGVATTPLAALPTAAPHAKAPQRGEGALSTTWVAPDDMPPRGQVVTAPIPAGDQSGTRGFSPRDAVIYLPPAYLTQERPALPVVVALTGQPGSPSDWFELGGLKDTMDAYAAAHDGLAPVVVVADLLGSPYRNPLCSDTVRGGRVATYLERDVPDWIRQNLQVDLDPEHWAVAGLSNGGTCALQVAARSPEVYRNFLAMSAEEHPSLGSEQRTINVGFDGDRASYEANDPLTIMASAPPGRYSGVSGIVSVGRDDKQYRPVVPVLVDATTQAGMSVSQREYAGGHTWATWSVAMADQMDWLGRRLGIVPDV